MKIIELLNKIANKEIKDKTRFRIYFNDGEIYRDLYYDANEPNEIDSIKNISDDYPIYDEVSLNDEIYIMGEYIDIDNEIKNTIKQIEVLEAELKSLKNTLAVLKEVKYGGNVGDDIF